MNCPRCDSPTETEALQEFGGVCPKCLLEFAAEKDAPSFPNLEIQQAIGEGGMGVVYKAIQKQLGRTVALKVLSPQLSTDPSFVERFTREAKALASLNHPNIVAIYDSGVHDGVPYLIMEYVEGHSLRKMLAAKKLTAAQALQVVPQICDALAYAHTRGVVHRDVKPENILIDAEGRVKIADFGLAKLAAPEQTRITRTNMVMGTPNYMAPEQIENPSAVDHRADIYSLGVIFYEMLTGELPLGRFKPPSERASTDRRLDPVVMKTLEKAPDDRYQTADEVKDGVTHLGTRRRIIVNPAPRPVSLWVPWTAAAILAVIATFSAMAKDFAAAVVPAAGAVACFSWGLWLKEKRSRPAGSTSSRPAIRVVVEEPFKKGAIVMGVLGAILLGLGLLPSAFGLGAMSLGFVPLTLGILLVLGAMFFAIIALARHAYRRASGGSIGWAVALIVVGVLVLAGMLSRSSVAPRPPNLYAVPSVTVGGSEYPLSFRLKDAWPSQSELPSGLSYDKVLEGAAVFREEPPREDSEGNEIILVGPGKEMLPDVKLIRKATLLKGQVFLMGYEFKTEFARKRWEKAGLGSTVFIDGKSPQGLSLFDLGTISPDPSPEARAAIELLNPLLVRKMREAAARR